MNSENMSSPSSFPLLASTQEQEFSRPSSAGYHPSIWGDRFLVYTPLPEEVENMMKEQIQELREEVRRMLTATFDHKRPMQKICLIDSIQRLGVSYHFEAEIEKALELINKCNTFEEEVDETNRDNLHNVSLRFRILRQQGYHVSADVFERFMNKDGNFESWVVKDAKGMLSLYEASHLRVHGEDILEKALVFTTTHLRSIKDSLDPILGAQVSQALKRSIRRNLPRLEARTYMSFYEMDPSHNQNLLKFAKLDFNMLQKLYQKELSINSMWWKGKDVPENLPFVRDRPVELYFWALGVYFEPQFSEARKRLHRFFCMISITDDIYDSYGTLEELQLYTDAIERWDISCIDKLPKYMKFCYKTLLEVYGEIEETMTKEGRSYCADGFKESFKRAVRAYNIETKWRQEKYLPTMEEYMEISLVSCGYFMLLITSFISMGDFITREALNWTMSHPKMVRAAAAICRYMDDIMSHEFEQKRGHVASGVECYMKQYGVSKEYVYQEFRKQVENAWKDINEGCFRPTEFPMPLLDRIVNFGRAMDVLYLEEDGYTHAQGTTKTYIESLLINPVFL